MSDKQYFRIMLGRAHSFATECFDGGFIGADFGINEDLSNELPENWRDFNAKFIPIYIDSHPAKSKIAAGLACGAIHTVSKAINVGDIILGPTGQGTYRIGEVT
jgi:restriction system protein